MAHRELHPEVMAIRESLIELINHQIDRLSTFEVGQRFGIGQQRANLLMRRHWHAFSLDSLLGMAQKVNPRVRLVLDTGEGRRGAPALTGMKRG